MKAILLLPLVLVGCLGESVGSPYFVPYCDQYAPSHYKQEAAWSGIDNDATMNLLAERGWKNVRMTGGGVYIEADCPVSNQGGS